MLMRTLTVRVVPGQQDALEEKLRTISAEVFESQPGLLSYHIGRGRDGTAGDAYVLTSVWPSVEALQAMAGENWREPHIPESIAPLIDAMSIDHFDILAEGPRRGD